MKLLLTAIAFISTAAVTTAQEIKQDQSEKVIVIKESIKDSNDSSKKEVKTIQKSAVDGSVIISTTTIDGKIVEENIKIRGDENFDVNALLDSVLKEGMKEVDIDIDISGDSKIKVIKLSGLGSNVNINEDFYNSEDVDWIDINDLKEIEEIFAMNQKKPFLGVILDNEGSLEQGVKVLSVIKNSAAEAGGIAKEDIILSINSENVNSLNELVVQLNSKEVGEEISIVVSRNGTKQNLKATLKNQADCQYNLAESLNFKTPSCCDKLTGECTHHQRTYTAYMHQSTPKLGVYVEDLDDEMITDLKIKEKQGVLVTKVLDASAAKKMGLKVNDVIVKINNQAISNLKLLYEFLGEQKLGDQIKVSYYRYGKLKSAEGILFEFSHSDLNFELFED